MNLDLSILFHSIFLLEKNSVRCHACCRGCRKHIENTPVDFSSFRKQPVAHRTIVRKLSPQRTALTGAVTSSGMLCVSAVQ